MSKSSKEVEVRRYVLRPPDSFGWAIVVIGSDGYFSACSDYGNYAFIWGSHGRDDFREFLLDARKDTSYFANKLSAGGEVYDADATIAEVKKYIIELRREDGFSKEKARDEWDLLEIYDDLANEHQFALWWDHTSIEEAHDFMCRKLPGMVVAFVEKVMVEWLVPVLEEELKEEREEVLKAQRAMVELISVDKTWLILTGCTTRSGKQLFLCPHCGAVDPAPSTGHRCQDPPPRCNPIRIGHPLTPQVLYWSRPVQQGPENANERP